MWNIRLRTRFLINLWFFLSSITWSQAIFHLNAPVGCSMDEYHWSGYWSLMTIAQLMVEGLGDHYFNHSWPHSVRLASKRAENLEPGNELDVQVCSIWTTRVHRTRCPVRGALTLTVPTLQRVSGDSAPLTSTLAFQSWPVLFYHWCIWPWNFSRRFSLRLGCIWCSLSSISWKLQLFSNYSPKCPPNVRLYLSVSSFL